MGNGCTRESRERACSISTAEIFFVTDDFVDFGSEQFAYGRIDFLELLVPRYRASRHFTSDFAISPLATDAHSFREVVRVDTRVAIQDRSKLESFMMQWSGETVVHSPLILQRKWTRTGMRKVRPMLFHKTVLISGCCRRPRQICHVSRLIEISLSTSRHLSPVYPYLLSRFKQDKCKANVPYSTNEDYSVSTNPFYSRRLALSWEEDLVVFILHAMSPVSRIRRYLILISMTDLMRKFLQRIGKTFKSLSQSKLRAESSIEQKMIFHVTSNTWTPRSTDQENPIFLQYWFSYPARNRFSKRSDKHVTFQLFLAAKGF